MKHNIKIKGTVAVIVDAVDIEQAEIESPAILKSSASVRAMVAARSKEGMMAFRRSLSRNNHTLEYDNFRELPHGRVEVLFTVRAKTAEETLA